MNDDLAFIPCTEKYLPDHQQIAAAETAIKINPANRALPQRAATLMGLEIAANAVIVAPAFRLAVETSKYWGSAGVKLTVGFLDNAPADLRTRILEHMNAWSPYCNVKFAYTQTDPQVRIARVADGYWSYLGTDILHIPRNQQTMNLQGFTMSTPESEFHRVVRHETGHTLGFPHEHARKQLVARLDVNKTIAYFAQNQGWTAQTTREQVLTPLEETSIRGTPTADQDSIMTYQLPGSITIDGQPIRGGVDLDSLDKQFANVLYPLVISPPEPPQPPKPPEPPVSGSLKEFIDALFKQAEAAIAKIGGVQGFALLMAVKYVHALVLQWLTKNNMAEMTVTSTSQLQQIVDQIFDALIAATDKVWLKTALQIVEDIFDRLIQTSTTENNTIRLATWA